MASGGRGISKSPLRVAALLLIGIGLGACSTVPSWVDPTTWLGPDVSDQTQAADDGQYPDLSNMPDRPAPASTPDERAQVASSLAAARNNTEYSAETLRGGTEPAAAPPPAAAPSRQVAKAEERAGAAEAPPAGEEAPPPSQPKAAPVTEVATAAEPPAAPPSSGEPAVPAVPAFSTASTDGIPGIQPAVPADASLGFQSSKAPPLDASVGQFVPQPIIARYAQTASVSAAVAAPAVSAGQTGLKAPPGTRRAAVGTGEDNVGGPETMSGAVVANLTALQSPAAGASVYASPNGLPPVAVVLFPNDTIAVDSAGQEQVRAAVEAYRARGGQGYLRVVGHSSSRTGNMSLARHMELNFRKSQQRATSVARALIRAGIPANKVLVNAVGDSQPVYYESMPSGEDGNRRAEIFLQG